VVAAAVGSGGGGGGGLVAVGGALPAVYAAQYSGPSTAALSDADSTLSDGVDDLEDLEETWETRRGGKPL
jgi:hypothetical protein